MMTFLEAIAKEEGFGIAGNRPTRNNNPGDLEYHPWMKVFGATVEPRGRFAVFPTVKDGFAALSRLLTFPLYRGKTVLETLNIYAPPVENQTNKYIANVCLWTGLTPHSILTNDDLTWERNNNEMA
ncbi:MAG: hypothetical protein ACREOZ_04080 [Gloeomargaritales cyanobacterium]